MVVIRDAREKSVVAYGKVPAGQRTHVDRGVPEVWGSLYDVRDLLKATISMRDGRPLSEMKLGLKEKAAMHELLKKIHGTDIEKLLMEYHVIG